MKINKCKLGDLLYIKQGYAFKSEKYVERSQYRLCTLGNFDNNNDFKYNDEKAVYYPEDFPKDFLLNEGDLVLPLTEQTVGLFGNSAFIPHTDNFSFVLNQRVGKVIAKDCADIVYLHYLLSTSLVRNQIEATASGTKQRNTSPEKIYDVDVWVSDKTTQEKIGAFLHKFELKIQNNIQVCRELETMAKTFYDYWFTQFDFPNEEGKPYRSSGGAMEWNDQLKRRIPKGWEAGQLSDIANITMGQSPAGETYNEDGNGTIFYQGCTDFGTRFPVPRVYTTAPTRFAQAGDILMSVRAPVGTLNVAIEACSIGRGLAALNSKIGSQLYLWYTLAGFKQLFRVLDGNGTTFGSITKDALYEMKVVIPNLTQVRAFDKIVQPIEQKIRVIEEENRELTKLRDWLLPMLMNGQATVE